MTSTIEGPRAWYLGKDEKPHIIASLIENGTGQIRFLDAAYHRLGAYGESGCAFYDDEIYHAGKRLSIWLRHEFLRGTHVTNIDRGGWAPIDELVQDEDLWKDVHRELIKHGHERRKHATYSICYDKESIGGGQFPELDELMYNRTWLIALIIDNELWRWGRNKQRMEFTGARLHPDITKSNFAAMQKSFVEALNVDGADAAKGHPCVGWVRPVAVRCISGHSNGAVDLQLMAIPHHGQGKGGNWWRTARDPPLQPYVDCKARNFTWGAAS